MRKIVKGGRSSEGDKADVSDSTWTNYKSNTTQLPISNTPSFALHQKALINNQFI